MKILLRRYGGAHWARLETALSRGQISEFEALPLAFKDFELRVDQAIRYVLENVEIDTSFKTFVRWTKTSGHQIKILSGGFESFIRPLLAREGLEDIPFLANEVRDEGGVWKINSCASQRLCPLCHHCKTSTLISAIQANPETFVIYIGDGQTDQCPVQLADLVFAKDGLQTYCEENQIPYVPYQNFSEVQRVLQGLAA